MISIIICSRDRVALTKVSNNIEETIGVPYEIIAIDNTLNQYGICEAYNKGAHKARYPFLCFMHEDIFFETENWGELVFDNLVNSYTGLVGIAGGDTKSLVPSSWSIPVLSNEINLIQHFKKNGEASKHISETNYSRIAGNVRKVIALDGVWLCTKKKVFEEFKFDASTFPGFHGYDIDYSLQVGTKYKLLVLSDILIHHYSEGKPDRRWMESAFALSNKWRKTLPVSIYPTNKSVLVSHHWKTMQVFFQHLFRLKYPLPTILRYYIKYSFNRFFTLRRFTSMGKYILLQLFKK